MISTVCRKRWERIHPWAIWNCFAKSRFDKKAFYLFLLFYVFLWFLFRFVEVIKQFRDDVRNGIPLPSLEISFKAVINACECDIDAPTQDSLNLVRFIFLCKFTASIKASDNRQWQTTVDLNLGKMMKPHVDRLFQNNDKETSINLKRYLKALS